MDIPSSYQLSNIFIDRGRIVFSAHLSIPGFDLICADQGFVHIVRPLPVQMCKCSICCVQKSFPCHPKPLILFLLPCPQWALGRGCVVYVFSLELSILQSLILCALINCWPRCVSFPWSAEVRSGTFFSVLTLSWKLLKGWLMFSYLFFLILHHHGVSAPLQLCRSL